MKNPLKFREDGTFTIVQFTDIHWKDGRESDRNSRLLMKQVLEQEQPNLVVFTGDVVGGYNCEDPIAAFHEAVKVVEERRIPWAVVFGNHDTEKIITRQQFMDAVTGCECSVTEQGPEEISGYGNYVLQIEDGVGHCAATLYFLDSGSFSSLPHVKGYDWIRRDQVDWYVQQSREITASNGGTPIPALAFFHIPLPEYREVWEREVCYGNKFENVCCPPINTGLFAAMVEMGDVAGTFVGHDHTNDYWGSLHGIRLCYGRATGYNTYGQEGFPRGARVIRLTAGERQFESWLRLDDGSVIREQPEHRPSL
ncbi:metallophosphoesterase family protein [Paenibacillus sp. HB172176]|uniref:metallophosphoesterase family protein n=1 Tax=Paenibacillus sp. HB172176 TaxID=2493690 RepID=UPI001438C6B0|nr:metallophosphoesterase family protein [Paenibacillus sp. HB172176]